MMTAKLRKMGEDAYSLAGSLADLGGPGRRRVRFLELRGLTIEDRHCLNYLSDFRHLEELELQQIDGTDLSPLAERELSVLHLGDARNIDLAPIASIRSLTTLALMEIAGCAVPEPFLPPPTVSGLFLWGIGGDGDADIEALIRNIDWPRYSGLTALTVSAGVGATRTSPDFLRYLPNLEWLEWEADIPAGPSPLRPPFDGLSRKLQGVRYSIPDAENVQAQLIAYLNLHDPSEVFIYDLSAFTAPVEIDSGAEDVLAGPWQAWRGDEPSSPTGYDWSTYHSFADLWPQFEVEYDALQAAIKLLKKADRKRAKKIDFDHDADGTGISANDLEDLEWALETLGVPREAD